MSAARTQAACDASVAAERARPFITETFHVYRCTSLAWQNAVPEMVGAGDTLDNAIHAGLNASQPKAVFFIRRHNQLTGRAIDSFYKVRETTKHTITRKSYDGGYDVRVKGMLAEFVCDVAVQS